MPAYQTMNWSVTYFAAAHPCLSISSYIISGGTCQHFVLILSSGESFAWGHNAMGQCGTGSIKKVKGGEDTILVPALVCGS